MSKVSVIIPSRREKFLQPTIDDVFKHAEEEVEVVVHLDGYWPDPPLKDNKRLIQIHSTECRGMRGGINTAVQASTGDYIFKLDGHCMLGQGFDRILKADCDDNMVIVPRRLALEPETWTNIPDKPPVDYHFLTFPFIPDDPAGGLHGKTWRERAKARKDILFDEEMSSQGSAYFLYKKFWNRVIGPLDDVNYGTFSNEFQEVGNKAWLSGGRVMVNKKTTYSHLFKGKKFGTGYGFSNAQWKDWGEQRHRGAAYAIRFWMLDEWKERTRNLQWLIEHFTEQSGPIPGWPLDLDEAFRHAREVLNGQSFTTTQSSPMMSPMETVSA